MSTAAHSFESVSVEDYLAGEETAKVRHEYVAGVVYAMSGGTINHNLISGNVFGALFNSLRGKPCRPFNSDMKVHIQDAGRSYFYYPDVSVVCKSNPATDVYQDAPDVIVEVLSRSTRRLDDGEKRDAYLTLPSLEAYLLIEQDEPAVKLYRRSGDEFEIEVYAGLESSIRLSSIGVELPLADIYDEIRFTPEPGDPEQTVLPAGEE